MTSDFASNRELYARLGAHRITFAYLIKTLEVAGTLAPGGFASILRSLADDYVSNPDTEDLDEWLKEEFRQIIINLEEGLGHQS
jgi:hypothetical protein